MTTCFINVKNGDDKQDGLTPEMAVKSADRLIEIMSAAGQAPQIDFLFLFGNGKTLEFHYDRSNQGSITEIKQPSVL